MVRKVSDDDTSISETSKVGEYAYANPYQPDKWSLQAIALGQKGISDYETIPDMGYSGDSRNPYSEIKPDGEFVCGSINNIIACTGWCLINYILVGPAGFCWTECGRFPPIIYSMSLSVIYN